MATLLDIQNLSVHFPIHEGVVKAVNGIDLQLNHSETLALVGESGSGKSVTALSVLGLQPHPGQITGGRILFEGQDLLRSTRKDWRKIRGGKIGLILQDPGAALNPVLRVGGQIREILLAHLNIDRKLAKARALALMHDLHIPAPDRVYNQYPHELSGGMKQRVLIAMALACSPALLIADEPTTALDVSIQSQILELLQELKREKSIAMLLITHDLSVVAQIADRVAVIYAGSIVENAPLRPLMEAPLHPYTRGLMAAVPRLPVGKTTRIAKVQSMAGTLPDPIHLPEGCVFHPRCPLAEQRCRQVRPESVEPFPGHQVACFNWNKRDAH